MVGDPAEWRLEPGGIRLRKNTENNGISRMVYSGRDGSKVLEWKELCRIRQAESGRAPRIVRSPTIADGVAVHDLVRACPPLDLNSIYSNLLQCTHFASTCALALDGAEGEAVIGWLSAYRPPSDPETLFVWQVAVAPAARRTGVAHELLDDVLAREACRGVVRVCASVTATNVASLGFFESFARRHGAHVEVSLWLDESEAFRSRHESEWLVRIDDVQPGHRPPVQLGRPGR